LKRLENISIKKIILAQACYQPQKFELQQSFLACLKKLNGIVQKNNELTTA